jgi:hypothetical protein
MEEISVLCRLFARIDISLFLIAIGTDFYWQQQVCMIPCK